MKPGISFPDVLILMGALQGFIISALFFFNKNKTQSDRFFSLLLFFISLACLNIYLLDINFAQYSRVVAFIAEVVPLLIIMPLGPLAWFYIKSLVLPDFRFQRRDWIHFYPVIIDLVPNIAVLVYTLGTAMNLIDHSNQKSWSTFIDYYNVYADVPRWISLTWYVLMARRQIVTMKIAQSSWPGQFVNSLLLFQSVWLVYLIPYVIPGVTWTLLDTVWWYPLYVPLAAILYFLSIRGYIFKRLSQSTKITASPVDKKSAEATIELLSKSMTIDKLFLNPSLTVDEVSKSIGVRPKLISAVINQHLQKSFNEYVNGFRVEEVKRRLLLPGQEHLTITGIALECGFNSQPTFQRTFKQMTGHTPSEFVRENEQNASKSTLKSGSE